MDQFLKEKYEGKYCTFTYPGYQPIHGIVDSIVVDILKLPAQELIIKINDGRYTVSLDSLRDCLKILR